MSKIENSAVRGSFHAGLVRKRTALMVSAGVLALVSARPAMAQVASGALPTNPTIVAGSGSSGVVGSDMTITQTSDRAVITWDTFDIGSAASVTFVQPATTSIALNRVTTGTAPSQINGRLAANGIVAILNPNGVLFGGTADVDVGGLIASSGDIDTGSFMAGGSVLGIANASAREIVVSAGADITIAEAGLAAFVGPRVRNEGTITARLGKVALGAGESFTLDLAGDGLLEIGLGSASPLVQNSGSILAEGGLVRISARAASALVSDIVNVSGVVAVGSVSVDDGTVVLEAANGGVLIDGTITAGDATLGGRRIHGAGDVDASGTLAMTVDAGGADTVSEGNFIGDALGVIGTVAGGTTLNLGAGTYRAGATIGTNNVTVDGGEVARISATANGEDGIVVNADGVTVRGLEIFGPADQAYTSYGWGSAITRGVVVRNGADNVTVSGNNIHDVRNGILIDGRNASAAITGNVIDNTKSGISVQYTDGSAMTISGNREGSFGNEWGLNVHLNGILQSGGAITPSAGALGAATPLAEQQRLLALSAANDGFSVFNQAWSASNRTHVNVATTGAGSAQGSLLTPISTVQGGVDAVVSGGLVTVQAGNYSGNVKITKAGITLASAAGRDATTITGVSGVGALGALWLGPNANNTTIDGFTIVGIDNGAPGIENAALYVQGANSGTTIRNNRITANGEHGFLSEYGAAVTGLTIDGNIFDGKTYVGAAPANVPSSQQFTTPNFSRQLVVMGGGNGGGNTSNVTFTNNQLTGDSGLNTAATIDVQGATISGNSFATTTGGFASMLRVRGTNTVVDGNSFVTSGLGATANALYVRNSAFSAGQADFSAMLAANSITGKGAWANTSASDFHSLTMSINAAIAEAASGAIVSVRPGDYVEGVTGVGNFGGSGAQKFGLYAYKDDITLRGVDASGNAITDADDVSAYVTAAYQAGFGAQHWVSGSNVVIEGLGFRPAAAGDNKLLEVVGDNFTLRNSVLDNRGNVTAAAIYIDAQQSGGGPAVESFNISNNILYGGTSPYTIAVIAGGVGLTTDASNRVFDGNRLIGSGVAGQRGFQIQGRIPSTAWQQLSAGAVTVTNNSFSDVEIPVRTVGILVEDLAWNDVLFNNGNAFNDGAVLAFQGNSTTARGTTTIDGAESYEDIRITAGIQASIDRALAGDTVRMVDGTYKLGTARLIVDKSITLAGQSQSGVIIDGRGIGAGLGTMLVSADHVTLSGFTLYGADSGANNYGIKVQPNPTGYNANQRLLNFAISDVTVRGSTRAELDLNGVVGATITNFTADGRRVGDDRFLSGGAGVQITDSQNVTLNGVTTLGNAWGSVAIYQANKSSGYNALTDNINIDAGANSFAEEIGVFVQVESALHPQVGQLNLTGFDYAVRNTGHRAEGSQFTFYRTNLNDALAFALGLGAAETSSVEGWSGTAFTNVFTVDGGLTINAAVRDVRAGGTVNVGAGTYAEAVAVDKGITLAGAGMDSTVLTNGLKLSGSMTDLTLSGFTVRGASGSSVINGGQINGLTVDGVRIDGEGVAGRHGFIGGQYSGDISITNSEFLNIRGWAAFDTRSGAGGANDGTQITSAVFSNNLLDNTAGHIAFRQQSGAFAYPDVTFSGNTVTNVGDSTLSFGAIFKAFRAGTVDFTGNSVSDVGVSSWTPTGEATYGAVLMTRDVALLNVIGNSFTNNNQVFAVEPGLALPTATNFSGNSFVNNRYAIYLPGNTAGGGTIQFGAGNDFVAGANTLQHIVWRSAAALDLTAVRFDGTLASDMGLADLFALEDLISHALDVSGAGLATVVDGQLYVTTGAGADAALRANALAAAGDTINLSAGTHSLSNTLFLQKDGVSVLGQGMGATVLDASGHGSYGIRVHGDDVTLSGFTLNGSPATTNASYGIKVEAGSGAGPTDRNTGFTITNVAIDGSRRTGLDLNAAVDALIDGVSVRNVVFGNGIAITDSRNVTVRNSATSGNGWGGLALYQSNNIAGGGSDQQLDGVIVEASNAFGEANGVYLQASSTLHSPGALTIEGYDFTVRNAAHRADGSEFTFFQKGLQDALDFAVNLDPSSSDASLVRGWTGTADDDMVHVGFGTLSGGGTQALSIQTAFDLSGAGDTVSVGAGTYGQSATLGGQRVLLLDGVTLDALTLTAGAAGTSLAGNITAAGAGFTFGGDTVLAGDTVLTGGDVSLAGVTGAHALTVSGGAVTLGTTNVASLSATGTTIGTAGVTTTGAQSYTGATTLSGSYTGGSFAVTGATTLAGATTVSTGAGAATFGAIGGANALTVSGGAVTLGAANIASLSATGTTIGTAGVTTTGAQNYSGATTLNGGYTGGSFAVTGTTTLGGATTVSTGTGAANFGTIGGANALTVSGGAVTLGAANIASLSAVGTTIATAGVTTTGAQSYTGATTLNGSYTGASFAVTGPTTLGGATNVSTGTGAATFGTIGGANALTVSGGTVTLGAADIASLNATGTTIATTGVTTAGAQSYTGATTLNGGYTGGSFAVTGPTTLGGATNVSTGTGAATFGTIGGANALTVSGGAVTLGAANIASLNATGTTIATTGVTTTGAQSYTGATTLNGGYTGGSFAVTGATTLGGATTVSTGTGAATFGAIGGANALTVSGGAVTLGAADIASLNATGTTIGTAGVTTTGAQSYTGATTLNGGYTGGSFAVTGATTLGGATNVSTGAGAATFGTIGGANALTVSGGAVTLGAADIASLSATGTTIGTVGVTTTGAQSYTGATTLNGSYTGGSFAVTGPTTLGGNTSVTSNGAVTFGTIDGARSFTLAGGAGPVTLGAMGAGARLGATSITGNQVVLNGNRYAAASLIFSPSGTGATVRVTQALTTFDTFPAGGPAGSITILPQLIGTAPGGQSLAFVSGVGTVATAATDGSITLGNVGSDSLRLQGMSVTGGTFEAQTVKLAAGGFSSTLSGNQTFSAQTLDSLGNVSASVVGNETGPIVSGGTVSITAGGGGTGSIQSAGPVTVSYGSNVNRAISSSSSVSLSSTGGSVSGSVNAGGGATVTTNNGSVTSTINAGGPVTVGSNGGTIASAITSTGPVSVSSNSGSVGGSIQSGGAVTVTSNSGAVGGAITSTGPVTVTSNTGSVAANITSGSGVSVSSTTGNVGGSVSANGPVNLASSGTVSSSVNTTGSVAITSTRPVAVQVNGGSVQVNAPGGTVTGNFTKITTNDTGTFVVNDEPVVGSGAVDARQIILDTFVTPAGGTVSSSGVISLPVGFAIAAIAPAGAGQGSRPAVLVNNVERLGELLRLGYTAIVVQIDENGNEVEQELVAAN